VHELKNVSICINYQMNSLRALLTLLLTDFPKKKVYIGLLEDYKRYENKTKWYDLQMLKWKIASLSSESKNDNSTQ